MTSAHRHWKNEGATKGRIFGFETSRPTFAVYQPCYAICVSAVRFQYGSKGMASLEARESPSSCAVKVDFMYGS